MSVPKPSLARTTPDAKITVAEPAFFTLKTTLIILPAVPLNPGFGSPPTKEIVPAELEKVGSSTHKEKIAPDLFVEITSRKSIGK